MSDVTARVADATGNWVDTRAPSWSRPYLRLSRFDRPIGSWLLLMPCWWSAALAAGIARDVSQLPLVIVAVLHRRLCHARRRLHLERHHRPRSRRPGRTDAVAADPGRTGERAAGGGLSGRPGADRIGGAAAVQPLRVMTGIASLVIVAVYPFMKRITWWPQIVLGLAFSWGALMGFAVTLGRIDATALLLYAGSIAWVIGYDTIYAHQDAEDDALIGIKSTARLFGARTRRALVVFYRSGGGVDRRSAGAGRRRLAGVDRAGRIRRASGLADPAAGDFRSRAVPAAVQIQSRRRAAAVRGIAGRMRCCGPVSGRETDAWNTDLILRSRARSAASRRCSGNVPDGSRCAPASASVAVGRAPQHEGAKTYAQSRAMISRSP